MASMKDFFSNLFGNRRKQNVGRSAVVQPKQPATRPYLQRQREEELYKPGDMIAGKYEVHRKLGKGGFGIVYLVYDREVKGIYALKTFRDEFLPDATAREAFKKEALLWVNVEAHPFILVANWVEEFSGRLFICMDYIPPDERGRVSLQDYVLHSRGPLDIEQVLEWAVEFCYGMEHANAHGIKCHRDIKPLNILITPDGILKITDFGLAAGAVVAWRGGTSLASVSADGRPGCSLMQAEGKVCCGTPGYIAPEVYRGEGADVRSDIYSFGCVLWQMAKGSPVSPFHAYEVQYRGDERAYIKEYQQKVYEKQKAGRVPAVNNQLQPVIEQCLMFTPSRRYKDFQQLRLELGPIFERLAGRRVSIPKTGEKTAAFWIKKGFSFDSLGWYEEAIDCHNKAIEIDPLNATIWNNKGTSFAHLGRYQEAVDCYDKAIDIFPREAGFWNNKGNSLGDLGRYNEAISCFDKAIEIDRRDAPAWYSKGSILASLGRYQEAIDCCNNAIEIEARYAHAWTVKGNSFLYLGCYDEAIDCFNKTVEIEPLDAGTWNNKAGGLLLRGRYQEAIDCSNRAIEIKPTYAKAWTNKGSSLASLGRYQEAIDCYNKAIEFELRNAEAWFNKAFIEDKIGNWRDAAKSYRSFIDCAPSQFAQKIAHARQRLTELEK